MEFLIKPFLIYKIDPKPIVFNFIRVNLNRQHRQQVVKNLSFNKKKPYNEKKNQIDLDKPMCDKNIFINKLEDFKDLHIISTTTGGLKNQFSFKNKI